MGFIKKKQLPPKRDMLIKRYCEHDIWAEFVPGEPLRWRFYHDNKEQSVFTLTSAELNAIDWQQHVQDWVEYLHQP